MVVRMAELEIDRGSIDAFNALLSEEIEASVRLEFAIAVKENSHLIRVIEGYADQAAYEAHLTMPHFLKYKVGTADMVKSLRLIETDPISLKAKPQISN